MEFLFGYTNIIVNGVIILITILNVVIHKLRKLQEEQYVEQNHRLSSLSNRGFCGHFSLDQMKRATSNFHEDLVIGEGGFGKVYKGTFELGPAVVAIKRLESTSNQGSTEFRAEIEMLSKHRHSHLVSLIGYCDDSYEMILVYEFMPGGTLADHLYKRVRKGDMSLPPLSWVQRLKICIGAARGLDYLHTGTGVLHRIIHRDVKSTNILLDENLAAKISDFGLSKISPANQASTYVSTHVKGTFGYLDPYYFSTRRLTKKSDVYSFGVVLFEVLCGRPAVDRTLDAEKMGLAGWAQHCFREGLLDQIIDPRIKGEMDPDSLEAFVKLAIQCLHIGPKHRPNMGKVVVKLESALALQEKNTEYILAEITSSNYIQEDVDFSKLDMETESSGKGSADLSNGGRQENHMETESSGKGSADLSNGGRQENQSSGRITFAKRFGVFLSRMTRARSVYRDTNIEHKLASEKLKKFVLIDLERATYNFKEVLGEGRSGKIFKGWIHERTYAPSAPDIGLPIAVKRFVLEHAQGLKEWQNEIHISRKYSHPNFVKLLGYCSEGQERLLVYEYMQNRDLDTHIFRNSDLECRNRNFVFFSGIKGSCSLGWEVRLNILIGVARCLAFFHTAKQIFVCSDLKASRILLDGKFNAKLSPHGLARLTPSNRDRNVTRTLPLEFANPIVEFGIIGVATDVYAFGVVMLEIMTSIQMEEMLLDNLRDKKYCRTLDNMLLDNLRYETMPLDVDKHWVLYSYAKSLHSYLDPSLKDSFPRGARTTQLLSSIASLITKCLDESPSERPSMLEVLEHLTKLLE